MRAFWKAVERAKQAGTLDLILELSPSRRRESVERLLSGESEADVAIALKLKSTNHAQQAFTWMVEITLDDPAMLAEWRSDVELGRAEARARSSGNHVRESVFADISRAVRVYFPERADRIMREIELHWRSSEAPVIEPQPAAPQEEP